MIWKLYWEADKKARRKSGFFRFGQDENRGFDPKEL